MKYKFQNLLQHSVETTNEWINDLDERLGWENKDLSFRILRATLHELRDLLPIDEAAQLSAQLPLFIKGLYFEEWNPTRGTKQPHDKASFLERIVSAVGDQRMGDPGKPVSAVFAFLNKKVSEGEISDVIGSLRPEIQDMWRT